MAVRRVTIPAATAATAICALLATGCTSGSTDKDLPSGSAVTNHVDPCELGNPLPNGTYGLNRLLNVKVLRTVEITLPGDVGSRRACRFDNGSITVETFAEAKGSTAVYDRLVEELKGGYNLHAMVVHTEDIVYPSGTTESSASATSSATSAPSPSVSRSSEKVPGFWLTNRGVREAAIFNAELLRRDGYKATVLVTINRSAKISGGVFATLIQEMRTDVYNLSIS